ncbi:hypothetical protein MP638_006122 [Amoeboaphelidium occidentale]|nr:hypothetical protein MP638_006122 [Amoeboaphelidium occidentale]
MKSALLANGFSKHKICNKLLCVVVLLLLSYVGFLLTLLSVPEFQRSLVLMNWREVPKNPNFTHPHVYGFSPDEVKTFRINGTNGSDIGVWEFSTASSRSDLVIVFIHGNRGNRADKNQIPMNKRIIRELKCRLIAFDYRGLGDTKAPEKPTEEGILQDNLDVWNYVTKKYKYQKKMLIGHSLGTALSTRLVMELNNRVHDSWEKPSALVLMSPFYSITEVLVEYPVLRYLFTPLKVMKNWKQIVYRSLADKFDTSKYLANIFRSTDIPLYIMHGTEDEKIPTRHGRMLFSELTGFDAFETRKEVHDGVIVNRTLSGTDFVFGKYSVEPRLVNYLEVNGADHNNIKYYYDTVYDKLESILAEN